MERSRGVVVHVGDSLLNSISLCSLIRPRAHKHKSAGHEQPKQRGGSLSSPPQVPPALLQPPRGQEAHDGSDIDLIWSERKSCRPVPSATGVDADWGMAVWRVATGNSKWTGPNPAAKQSPFVQKSAPWKWIVDSRGGSEGATTSCRSLWRLSLLAKLPSTLTALCIVVGLLFGLLVCFSNAYSRLKESHRFLFVPLGTVKTKTACTLRLWGSIKRTKRLQKTNLFQLLTHEKSASWQKLKFIARIHWRWGIFGGEIMHLRIWPSVTNFWVWIFSPPHCGWQQIEKSWWQEIPRKDA